MFAELLPLLQERTVQLVMSASENGVVTLYVVPSKKKDDEADAFCTSFQVRTTAEELDRDLPAILKEWVGARRQVTTTLADALAQAKADLSKQADEAKKKADEAKKKGAKGITATKGAVATKPVAALTAPTPSLLDDQQGEEGPLDDDPAPGEPESTTGENKKESAGDTAPTENPAPPSAPAAAAVEPATISLFDY